MAFAEADGWSVLLPGVPVAADAASFDDAVTEFDAAVARRSLGAATERLARYYTTGE